MAKSLKERKAEIAARQQAFLNIFPWIESLNDKDPLWKFSIFSKFEKHPYVLNMSKIEHAWFWTSESTAREEADQDLFIEFLLDINDELTILINNDSGNHELYDTQCRLFLELWNEVKDQRPNESELDYRLRLLDFNAVLDRAAQFPNIKNQPQFFLIKTSVYNALWEIKTTQQDSSFLCTICTLFPEQKDEALYHKLWDLEKVAPAGETPAAKKARLIRFNAFLTKELNLWSIVYCKNRHSGENAKDVNTIIFSPLDKILSIKGEIYNEMGYPKAIPTINFAALKTYYRDTCDTFLGSIFGGESSSAINERDKKLADARKYYDNMVAQNQIEGELPKAIGAFPRLTTSDKEEIKKRMAERSALLNNLRDLFLNLQFNLFKARLGTIDAYLSNTQKRHADLERSFTINAMVDSEDKNVYQNILTILMSGLLEQVPSIKTHDQQTALIDTLEQLWPAIQERWIKPNSALETEVEHADRMLHFGNLLTGATDQIITVSDSEAQINRILALKKNVGWYAQSTSNGKVLLSFNHEYLALSERITTALQSAGNPTLPRVKAMIASCQSLWPMQSVQLPGESDDVFRQRLIAFNHLLTQCSLLILTLGTQDQHEQDIRNIFDLKQDLRRALQPSHGVKFTQAIAQNFHESQTYYLKRFNDKKEFSGWFWGYSRTQKLTGAMRSYDDIIEKGYIDEASYTGAVTSNRLGDIMKKLFSPLAFLKGLFTKRAKVEVLIPNVPVTPVKSLNPAGSASTQTSSSTHKGNSLYQPSNATPNQSKTPSSTPTKQDRK